MKEISVEEEVIMWEDLSRLGTMHYSVMKLKHSGAGMEVLRTMFPDAETDKMNFVLFSTSGVHGTYTTIEDVEIFLKNKDPEGHNEITFIIVHPRTVTLRYGVCNPQTQDDIDFLKRLRANSHEEVIKIGV